MGGAEVAASQAAAAEVHPDRHDGVTDQVKDPHGAHLDAGATVAAPALVDPYLDGKGSGGTDLQSPSPFICSLAREAGRAVA